MTQSPPPNPIGLDGIEFIEFASPDPEALHRLFTALGFSRLLQNRARRQESYRQNDIHFIVNQDPTSFSASFSRKHGPCISAMGWRVADAERALQAAMERGARACDLGDLWKDGKPIPAIYGIGDSLIYFIDDYRASDRYLKMGFSPAESQGPVEPKGFTAIDHLTNNVEHGTLKRWADFYKEIFGFTEVRYFDIRGVKTGLLSYALRSPCGKFCIPINEGTEQRSQINEYLREYQGPGVQHLAFLTDDILATLDRLACTSIETLEIDDEYYRTVFDRVPNVTEDRERLQDHQVLIDGDEKGYLLQIFTKNLIGPIFIEIIQRKNHLSFGEGNFGALFRSIERDQQRRGRL